MKLLFTGPFRRRKGLTWRWPGMADLEKVVRFLKGVGEKRAQISSDWA
jgi:hypothetical protein